MKFRPRRTLPRKGVPAGAPGVDRGPARLWRTEARYCPVAAKWVGTGSRFANPFIGTKFQHPKDSPMQRPLFEQAALLNEVGKFLRFDRSERWTGRTFERPSADLGERYAAAAFLYREWRASRLQALPRAILFYLERDVDAALLANPPSDEEIVRELRGFDLASEIPYGSPAHVDEILRVANADAPTLFEERKA